MTQAEVVRVLRRFNTSKIIFSVRGWRSVFSDSASAADRHLSVFKYTRGIWSYVCDYPSVLADVLLRVDRGSKFYVSPSTCRIEDSYRKQLQLDGKTVLVEILDTGSRLLAKHGAVPLESFLNLILTNIRDFLLQLFSRMWGIFSNAGTGGIHWYGKRSWNVSGHAVSWTFYEQAQYMRTGDVYIIVFSILQPSSWDIVPTFMYVWEKNSGLLFFFFCFLWLFLLSLCHTYI
jgi:hypothetical protein